MIVYIVLYNFYKNILQSKVKMLAIYFFLCYTAKVIGQINTQRAFQDRLPERL